LIILALSFDPQWLASATALHHSNCNSYAIMILLMGIQDTLWAIFQPLPLAARVSMPFHIHAKSNINKKNLI